jgi:hypothetical protein
VPTPRQEGAFDEAPDIESPPLPDPDDDADGSFFLDWWDDAGADVSERMDKSEGPEWNALEEHEVSEAMTRGPLLALPASASVQDAARMMDGSKVHRILVTDGDQLVGIITSSDIARAVADDRLTKRVYVLPGRAARRRRR